MTKKEKTIMPEEGLVNLEIEPNEKPVNTLIAPQTETEKVDEVSEGMENSATSDTISQTEEETSESASEFSTELNADGVAPQTETVKPKRTRRSKKTELNSSQSDGEGGVAVSDAVAGIEKPKPVRTSTKPKQSVVAIDDIRTVETDADKSKNDLLDLLESLKTGRILTGTVQGVERTADSTSVAVIYHGVFKVVVPAKEMLETLSDNKDEEPDDVQHLLLTKRLGAEVDYIIKGIDSEANVAVASRLDAMKAKRKSYYFGTDRDGNNILYAGVCAEARVVSVIRSGIFADIFGVESYIPLKELSYQRMMDAAGYFQTGQRILVKILNINKEDKNNIKVTASVKQASENPYEKALKKYTVGNRYVGTVSMVDVNGVFVALDGGIDCLCSYPKRGRPPRGARVTVRVLGINHDTNRIWGAITHTALPR